MPEFVSVFGVWKPKLEQVYLPDKEEIYKDLDRAALQMLEENGGTMGHHFKEDADFVMRVKQLGFSNIEDYLKFRNFDEKKYKDRFDKELATPTKHENPKPKPGINPPSGGDDTSGQGNHIRGEFKAPPIHAPRMKG